jgi:hypothetical protein
MLGTADGLVPLVLGVTGHRAIAAAERPAIESAVRAYLQQLTQEHPHTPLLLITPLAEGADRLVARVALEFGAELVAALPFPLHLYERDFADDASRAELRALLESPRTVRRVTIPTIVADPSLPVADPGTRRDLQYALVGAYVARHCAILIAIWDGVASTAIGGTADIVHFRSTGTFHLPADCQWLLSTVPDPFGIPHDRIDPPTVGPIYHIPTSTPADAHYVIPDGTSLRQLAVTRAFIDRFNRRATDAARRRPAAVDRRRDALGATTHQPLTPLRNAFALADTLALGTQRQLYAVLFWLFAGVFAAVGFFEVYAHLVDATNDAGYRLLIPYLGFLAAADLLYLAARVRRTQDDFQDDRTTAEGLRVLYYWRLAGVTLSAADYYLRKQRDELAWIFEAIRAWGVRAEPTVEPTATDRATIVSHWIGGQLRYFTTAATRDARRQIWYRDLGSGLIIISFAWAAAHLVQRLHHDRPAIAWLTGILLAAVFAANTAFGVRDLLRSGDRAPGRGVARILGWGRGIAAGMAVILALQLARRHLPAIDAEWHGWFVAGMGLLALGGAFCHAFAEQRAFAQHSRQYARMADVFARAADAMSRIPATGAHELDRQLVTAVGREALAEHADWLLVHRERPLELPKAEL